MEEQQFRKQKKISKKHFSLLNSYKQKKADMNRYFFPYLSDTWGMKN
jgi:hypothetical protein